MKNTATETQEPSACDEFSNEIIKLDIGGKIYKTSLQTIMKDSSSMLAAMFSGRLSLIFNKRDGSYFIDRDGETFRYILNYLRNGTLVCPDDITTRQEILKEAEFYQIQGLIHQLETPRLLQDKSTIVTNKEHDAMVWSWLPLDSHCDLLYRASRDGWTSMDFHRSCDNKGRTLVLMRSSDGFTCGGYTTQSWESTRIEKTKKDEESFLFTLTNPSSHKLRKFCSQKDPYGDQGGIVCSHHIGPYFGTKNYFDLKILQVEVNKSTIFNYVDLGHGFECPTDLHSKKFMFGSGTFLLSEIEVFNVH